jgi:hypothetical protein
LASACTVSVNTFTSLANFAAVPALIACGVVGVDGESVGDSVSPALLVDSEGRIVLVSREFWDKRFDRSGASGGLELSCLDDMDVRRTALVGTEGPSAELAGSPDTDFDVLELRRDALTWPVDELLELERDLDLGSCRELLVMGGRFEASVVVDLGALWPEVWYFLGGGAGFDSVGDEESRSRRDEVLVLERRGALVLFGNLGDAELDTSGEFMLILASCGQRSIECM